MENENKNICQECVAESRDNELLKQAIDGIEDIRFMMKFFYYLTIIGIIFGLGSLFR